MGGRSRAHRKVFGAIWGWCAPSPGSGARAAPAGAALLQHQLPQARSCQGHGHQLCPLTTSTPPIAGDGRRALLLLRGANPAPTVPYPGGAAAQGRMYCPSRGHGSAPEGPPETTKPHADRDSMRSWSPKAGLCITGLEVDSLRPWIYHSIEFCGRHSACRPYRQAQIIITVWLCQDPFFRCSLTRAKKRSRARSITSSSEYVSEPKSACISAILVSV